MMTLIIYIKSRSQAVRNHHQYVEKKNTESSDEEDDRGAGGGEYKREDAVTIAMKGFFAFFFLPFAF